MRKLIILVTTALVSLSCLMMANTASARTEVSAMIVQRGHHHFYPSWHHRHPHRWQRHHRHHSHWHPRRPWRPVY